ncbi:MAG: metalloregulator ArsR/SmtB family transcription factor [bacterium]|nr:metalloregulator ArsR/SmtB family transcription factor [bacterium]
MNQSLTRLKAIADPGRLRVLSLVNAAGEICVCQIETIMKLPQPTVSHQLNRLKESGWLEDRRQGRWVYYHLADPDESPWRKVLEVILADVRSTALVQRDLERLEDPVQCDGSSKANALSRVAAPLITVAAERAAQFRKS